MMRKQILIALLCTLALLSACGKEEPLNWTPTPTPPPPPPPTPPQEDWKMDCHPPANRHCHSR